MLKKLTKLIPKCLRRKEEPPKEQAGSVYVDGGIFRLKIPDEILRAKPIRGNGPVAKHSHYHDPIILRHHSGESRDWGDVHIRTKLEAVGRIVAHFPRREGAKAAALLLALVYVESGFNPDAAAKSTSATGLGQFIDATGKAYGLTDATRWDLDVQIRALFGHYTYCTDLAWRRWRTFDKMAPWIYAYWHDGPSLKYGGYDIAVKRVMPVYREFLKGLK